MSAPKEFKVAPMPHDPTRNGLLNGKSRCQVCLAAFLAHVHCCAAASDERFEILCARYKRKRGVHTRRVRATHAWCLRLSDLLGRLFPIRRHQPCTSISRRKTGLRRDYAGGTQAASPARTLSDPWSSTTTGLSIPLVSAVNPAAATCNMWPLPENDSTLSTPLP